MNNTKKTPTDTHQMLLKACKGCGAESSLQVTFSPLEFGGLPCASTRSSQHQLSAGRGARLPKMSLRAARVQADCPLVCGTASNPSGVSQDSLWASWHQSRAVPVENQLLWLWMCLAWVTSQAHSVQGVEGLGVAAMSCLRYCVNLPKI